jgi:Tfp pilus assembly protein PilF
LKATILILALGSVIAGWAQQNPPPAPAAAQVNTNLLQELRITLPGGDSKTGRAVDARGVLVAPRLIFNTGTNTTAEAVDPIPLLRGSPNPEVSAMMINAMGLMASNQVYLASRELWKASRQATTHLDPAAGLALMYLLAEDNDRAANLLEKLVQADPSQIDLQFNLASARYGQGRYSEAVMILTSIKDIDRYPATIYYNLGLCLAAKGEVEDALRALRIAQERAPKNPSALVAMSRIHLAQGQVSPAIERMKEAAPLLGRPGLKEVLLEPDFRSIADHPYLLAFLRGEENP